MLQRHVTPRGGLEDGRDDEDGFTIARLGRRGEEGQHDVRTRTGVLLRVQCQVLHTQYQIQVLDLLRTCCARRHLSWPDSLERAMQGACNAHTQTMSHTPLACVPARWSSCRGAPLARPERPAQRRRCAGRDTWPASDPRQCRASSAPEHQRAPCQSIARAACRQEARRVLPRREASSCNRSTGTQRHCGLLARALSSACLQRPGATPGTSKGCWAVMTVEPAPAAFKMLPAECAGQHRRALRKHPKSLTPDRTCGTRQSSPPLKALSPPPPRRGRPPGCA